MSAEVREDWCNDCRAFHTRGVEVATCQRYVGTQTAETAQEAPGPFRPGEPRGNQGVGAPPVAPSPLHGCRLPMIRWLGRSWCCRCGAEWFCLLGASGKRTWVRRWAA